MKPTVVIESHIPAIPAELEQDFNVVRAAGDKISREVLRDASALIVRTRTRCDRELLEGSGVRLVGTATIGTDHIDEKWCEESGIKVVSAPGCNAPGVAQYVMSSVVWQRPDYKELTMAVVGVGHVGSLVVKLGEALGMRVMCVDPPRALREPRGKWYTLEEAATEADIVTFHTPLTRSGEYATYHLANKEFFDRLKGGAMIINAARGGVMDTEAALAAMADGRVKDYVIDCWEHEPHIDLRLLEKATVATPHIAGYSLQGKLRATNAMLSALSSTFGTAERRVALPSSVMADVWCGDAGRLERALTESYNPGGRDTMQLKESPESFDSQRDHYELRLEPIRFDRAETNEGGNTL